ncbi:hypothetical protein HNR46_000678 [Haloferula luteola]|uniref:Uncharacterized protein n=1 Tax=Haloferula luteola TaxID=595692 RepID=A0A840V482_9BACT|nr:hypothetical protein [Haloferula luteola]MBB5350454.1 hypothetical protein [Haloferula luteola]
MSKSLSITGWDAAATRGGERSRFHSRSAPRLLSQPSEAENSFLSAWLCVPLLFGAFALLTTAVILKEQPLFWRNAGGYPIWMRDTVRIFFWPFLIIFTGCLGMWSTWLLGAAANRGRSWGSSVTAVTGFWAALGGLMFYMVWNNLENVTDGHHWHYHNPSSLVR